MTDEMYQALHAVDVLAEVRARLVAGGAVAEVAIFDGLSLDELELVVNQELGLAA